jgi:HSP20 family protein
MAAVMMSERSPRKIGGLEMVSRVPVSDEFVSLREAVDRLVSDSFVGSPFRSLWSSSNGASRLPVPLDVYATNEDVIVIAAIPGIRAEDIEITINQGTVVLSGKAPNVAQSEEGKAATWFIHELPYGSFNRSITLPIEVDANGADASFENGILRLRLPKAEQAKPRQIKVRVPGAITAESN